MIDIWLCIPAFHLSPLPSWCQGRLSGLGSCTCLRRCQKWQSNQTYFDSLSTKQALNYVLEAALLRVQGLIQMALLASGLYLRLCYQLLRKGISMARGTSTAWHCSWRGQRLRLQRCYQRAYGWRSHAITVPTSVGNNDPIWSNDLQTFRSCFPKTLHKCIIAKACKKGHQWQRALGLLEVMAAAKAQNCESFSLSCWLMFHVLLA